MKSMAIPALAFLLTFFVASCSSIDDAPITPAKETSKPERHETSNCLGLWQVVVDAESGSVDIIDIRSGNLIINVLQYLEPPELTDLSIDFGTLQIVPADKYIGVDVSLVVCSPW